MDIQKNALLSCAYYCQRKTMEERGQSLLFSTVELEQTKLMVQEELKKRDDLLIRLKDLLTKTMKERDEAQEKCQMLIYENLLLQQQHQKTVAPPVSVASRVDDEQQQQGILPQQTQPREAIDTNKSFSSSDYDQSIVSPAVIDPVKPQAQPEGSRVEISVPSPEKPLPPKGNLLQAVLKAGPLLETLLLAGPLPQWCHPPPPLETFEIPPVTVPPPPPPPPVQAQLQDPLVNNNCGRVNRKRAFANGTNTNPMETKYQKVLLH